MNTPDTNFDIKWIAKIIDSNISDTSDAIPMATFKRFLTISAEDGDYFRAITMLNNLVMKLDSIEKHIDDGVNKITAITNA